MSDFAIWTFHKFAPFFTELNTSRVQRGGTETTGKEKNCFLCIPIPSKLIPHGSWLAYVLISKPVFCLLLFSLHFQIEPTTWPYVRTNQRTNERTAAGFRLPDPRGQPDEPRALGGGRAEASLRGRGLRQGARRGRL